MYFTFTLRLQDCGPVKQTTAITAIHGSVKTEPGWAPWIGGPQALPSQGWF